MSERYRFEEFTFEPETGELTGPDGELRLAPQPALVLTLLLRKAGELVTRDELKERVWPDTVVEFDKGLNFCVREVRAALGDRASAPTFVETLPRRGYRFIAPVEASGRGAGEGTQKGEEDVGRRFEPTRRVRTATTAFALLAVAALAWSALPDGVTREVALDPRAREAGEMGGYLLTRGEGDDVERSVRFFREALSIEPGYARARAGLGSAYLRLGRAEEGRAALLRSIETDPTQWKPHVTLALEALYVSYDRGAARPHFDRALELAPEEVVVRHTHAWWRAVDGDLAGAIRQMRAALDLDPVSPRVNGDVGRLFYLAGRHDEAVAHCRRTRELTPGTLRPRDCAVQALAEAGALAEAREEAVAAVRDLDAGEEVAEAVAAGAPSEGLDAYWRWAAPTITARADQGEDSHVHAAAAWARVGEADLAFEALEAAYAVRCPVLPQLGLDPALAPLREDPRFGDLLRRVGGGEGPREMADAASGSGPRGAGRADLQP